jgi:periplasmic divalent cation tolerance protein
MAGDVYVVLVTVPANEEGEKVALHIVEKRLGACVNMIRGVRSLYWWENRIQDDSEVLLVIKTSREALDDLIAEVKRVHPYSVPEIIALPVEKGNNAYLDWVLSETKGSK